MSASSNARTKVTISILVLCYFIGLIALASVYFNYLDKVTEFQELEVQGVQLFFEKHGEMHEHVVLEFVNRAGERNFDYLVIQMLMGFSCLSFVMLTYLSFRLLRSDLSTADRNTVI